MLSGMQRFRDGVLALWRRQEDPQQRISSEELLTLLEEIRSGSQDPQYWQDVMQIVPREEGFGLTLLEVSEAVCAWLPAFLQAAPQDEDKRGLGSPAPLQFQDRGELGRGLLHQRSTESLGSVSSRFPCWLETFRGLRKTSAASEASAPPAGAVELQRASELCEILSRSVRAEDVAARRAISKLSLVHDALARTLNGQEAEQCRLRRTNASLRERRRLLEAELARVCEQLDEAREAAARPEEQRRRAEMLEQELQELKDHFAITMQELSRLQAKCADADMERMDTQRRDWQWRDRCTQLEQAADTAEGHAKWMSSEVERQATRLTSVESRTQHFREVSAAWRWRSLAKELCSEPASLKDMANIVAALRRRPWASSSRASSSRASPQGTAASDARQPVAQDTDPHQPEAAGPCVAVDVGRPKTVEDLRHQVSALQAELQRMRTVRDELVAAARGQQAADSAEEEEEYLSPRQVQSKQRCTFLAAQLQALLRHTHEVEQVLDALHDSRSGGGPSPDVKRRLSIQRVQEADEAIFNELSQRLYTLEVQKADADQELRLLQARSAEQDRQLQAGRQRREVLLAELGAARQASGQEAGARSEYYVGTETTSTTCDTQSVASGSPGGGGNGSADVNGFLTPVQGALRSSPKAIYTSGVGVRKATAVQRFGFGAERTSQNSGSRGSVGVSNRRPP